MPHPLIDQLRFTRSEFVRGLDELSEEDAIRRLLPTNSISWNVGHLAWQEQRYFLIFGGSGKELFPEISRLFAFGAPACTPALADMLSAWKEITRAADPWLDTLTIKQLTQPLEKPGWLNHKIYANLIQRTIYHYWYHNGENQAIRQQLGHTKLEQFVGNIDEEGSYRPE
jgi:hypothetical protein